MWRLVFPVAAVAVLVLKLSDRIDCRITRGMRLWYQFRLRGGVPLRGRRFLRREPLARRVVDRVPAVVHRRTRDGRTRRQLFVAQARPVAFAAALLLLLTLPSMATAQDTREEEIAAEQAEKATHLTPRVPTRVEELLGRVRRSFTEQPKGFYPVFDSAYSGGGF